MKPCYTVNSVVGTVLQMTIIHSQMWERDVQLQNNKLFLDDFKKHTELQKTKKRMVEFSG